MVTVTFKKNKDKSFKAKYFSRIWKEITEFKESHQTHEPTEFLTLQTEDGRMILLTLYDKDRWVFESLKEDWGEQFGRIDLSKDFNVQEEILTDEELEEKLKMLMIKS